MVNRKRDHIAVATTLDTIEKLNMLKGGDSILISVSGGPDSVFLTHVFMMLRDRLRLKLYGFSMDHSTREGQSGRDLKFVTELYEELGIRLLTKKVDALQWCREQKLSFQEGARKLRAGFLREIASELSTDKIALGHNLDDNIETFLMRMIRGSGARGFSGIRPVDGMLIRPLINTSREDIEDYLRVKNISFCTDRSNLDNKYIRNRIRNRLIPFIKENFPGDLTRSLKRSMKILRDEDIFIRDYAAYILEAAAFFKEGSKDDKNTIYIKIPAEIFKSNPRAIGRRIIQAALEKILGSLEDINYRNIEDILELSIADSGENKWLRPIAPIMVFKINDHIHIADTSDTEGLDADIRSYVVGKSFETGEEGDLPGQLIRIGGDTDLKGFPFSVRAKLLKEPGDYTSLPGCKAVIDNSKVVMPIKVRSWSKGDRFYPLGMEGSKKLQDLFIDNKVPVNLRKKIPIFYDSEKVIWVGNIRIDSRVRATPETTDFLCLELLEK